MAIISPVYSRPKTGELSSNQTAKGAVVVTWANITSADTCAAVFFPEFEKKSIDVEVAGTTPSISIQGGNDSTATTPKTLSDSGNIPLVFTTDGVKMIAENTAYIQPSSVTGGVGATATVRLLLSSLQRGRL